MSRKAVIVSAVRTPFTRAYKGELKDTRPDTMSAWTIKEAIGRVPGLKGEDIEDVILGCAMPEAEQGNNVARQAVLMADLPFTVPAMTINRFCSSGVQSIALVANSIEAGSIEVGVAGGVETMSMIPMGGQKYSANPDLMRKYPEAYTTMGATAENVAARFGVTREEQDQFAYESQRRAAEAREEGRFKEEIIPITTSILGADGSAQEVSVDQDTILRPGTTIEALNRLRPVFRSKGTVTAGNASPLTDGAAAAVIMSAEKADALGIKPLGTLVDFQVAGVPPEVMGIGPVPAVQQLLEKNNLTVEDIDVVELNEAFAAQAVYCIKELGLDPEKVNPNGGAIALGHPLGVSGTRMTATLIYELRRRGGRFGIVTMCIGGGMGAAALIEVS